MTIMKNIENLIFNQSKPLRGFLRLFTFCSLALLLSAISSPIFADVVSMQAVVRDSSGQQTNVIYQQDGGVFLEATAGNCADSDKAWELAHGNAYLFKFEVTDPNGVKLKTYYWPRGMDENSSIADLIKAGALLPHGNNVTSDIPRSVYVSPSEFYTVTGDGDRAYTLSTTFYQKWQDSPHTDGRRNSEGEYVGSGRPTTYSVSQSYNFNILGGLRPGVTSLNKVSLVAPVDQESLATKLPFFKWTANNAGVKYTIYVSETDQPELNTYWSQSEIDVTEIQYPSTTRALIPGNTYYWMVQETSGGVLGEKSDVYSFGVLTAAVTDTIRLYSPYDGLSLKYTSMPEFVWSASLEEATYTFHLAKGSQEAVIYTYNSTEVRHTYSYLGNSSNLEPLEVGETYYWYVTATNGTEAKRSESTFSFTYSPEVHEHEVTALGTSLKGEVTNHRGISMHKVLVQGAFLGDQDKIDESKAFSVESDVNGKFIIADLHPGKYRVTAEASYAGIRDYYDEIVTIVADQLNQVQITMQKTSGQYSITFYGETPEGDQVPLPGVSAKFENRSGNSARVFSSDENGICDVAVRPGYYKVNYKIDGYIPQSLPRVYVEANKNDHSIVFKRVTAGGSDMTLQENTTNKKMSGLNLRGERQ